MALRKRLKSYSGDGEGYYYYRDSDVKYFEEKHFLDESDSIEQAINKHLRRIRKKMESKK